VRARIPGQRLNIPENIVWPARNLPRGCKLDRWHPVAADFDDHSGGPSRMQESLHPASPAERGRLLADTSCSHPRNGTPAYLRGFGSVDWQAKSRRNRGKQSTPRRGTNPSGHHQPSGTTDTVYDRPRTLSANATPGSPDEQWRSRASTRGLKTSKINPSAGRPLFGSHSIRARPCVHWPYQIKL